MQNALAAACLLAERKMLSTVANAIIIPGLQRSMIWQWMHMWIVQLAWTSRWMMTPIIITIRNVCTAMHGAGKPLVGMALWATVFSCLLAGGRAG